MISNAGNIPPHVLLTVLGTNPRCASYTLRGGELFESRLAPVALFNLLPEEERPDRILAVCTPEAKQESWPLLEQALNGRCQMEYLDVPSGETENDITDYLETVAGAIPGNVELTVDVTHGFRHFSFLIYIAVFYLNALRDVRVRGAWYGLLKEKGHPSPFLDLRPLLDLPDWIYALRVLRDTGSALPMAKVICSGTPNPAEQEIAHNLSQLSEAYLSGLPIELGRQSYDIRQSLKTLKGTLQHGHRPVPLSQELVGQFEGILKGFGLNDRPSDDDDWKCKVPLSEDELERQARIINDLLSRGNLAAAIGLMHEWTVSWIVLRCGREGEWLNFSRVRRKATTFLSKISPVGKNPNQIQTLKGRLTKEQRLLGEFWGHLTQLRNAYHHHGMGPRSSLIGEAETRDIYTAICEYWKKTLCSRPDFALSPDGESDSDILKDYPKSSDRRPPTEQDAEPYRVGEPFWLDSAGDGDAD